MTPTIQQQMEDRLLEQYPRFYRLAYSYLKDEADAQDAVQNGACKALKSWRSLKEPQYLDMEFKVRGAAPPGHRPRGLCAGCGGGAAVSGVRRPTAPPGPGSAQGGF
jgi:hypothetical protein